MRLRARIGNNQRQWPVAIVALIFLVVGSAPTIAVIWIAVHFIRKWW